MNRFECPICGLQQEFDEELAFSFCRRCGTKLLLCSDISPEAPAPSDVEKEYTETAEAAGGGEDELTIVIPQSMIHQIEEEAHIAESAQSGDRKEENTEIPESGQTDAAEEEEKRGGKGWLWGLLTAALIIGAALGAYFLWFKPMTTYQMSVTQRGNGEYVKAIEGFVSLGDYRDSRYLADQCRLEKALSELQRGELKASAASLASIEDKGLDTSLYDDMAGSHLQRLLIRDFDYEKALEAVKDLPAGRIKNLDASFEAAFRRSLDEKDFAGAARALSEFEPCLGDTAPLQTMVEQEMDALMEAGAYAEAAELTRSFSAMLAEPQEDVASRFQSLLKGGEYFRAAALLEVFGASMEDPSQFKKELEGQLRLLLDEEKDEEVVELCYAFQKLEDLNPLLEEELAARLKEGLKEGKYARVNALISQYEPYTQVSLTEKLRSLFDGMLEKEQWEEAEAALKQLDEKLIDTKAWTYDLALRCLEKEELDRAMKLFLELGDYKDSSQMVREVLYQRVLALWDEGRDEEARELIDSLGDSKESEEIKKEAQLRAAVKVMEAELPSPEDFSRVYNTLYGIRTHGTAAQEIRNVLVKWGSLMMTNVDRRPYLDALSNVSIISARDRNYICKYMLENTPAMSGHREDGSAWLIGNQWMPYNVYRFTELVSDDSGAARAFVQYGLSMVKDHIELEIGDLWNLWDVRGDIRALCVSNEYLILFLSGSWKTADGSASLNISRVNKQFKVSYNVPPTAAESGIRAGRFGLYSGNQRLCGIEVRDYNTIVVTNEADGKTYIMTRP